MVVRSQESMLRSSLHAVVHKRWALLDGHIPTKSFHSSLLSRTPFADSILAAGTVWGQCCLASV